MGPVRLICPKADALLFCDNETNAGRLYGAASPAWPKDGINDHVVNGAGTVNPDRTGTKVSALYDRVIGAGETVTVMLRLVEAGTALAMPKDAARVFADRCKEADAFYDARPPAWDAAGAQADRAAGAGRDAVVEAVLPFLGSAVARRRRRPTAAGAAQAGATATWRHLHAEDIVSMPDCWEYPWFASWDLCFHAVALARATSVRQGPGPAPDAGMVHAPRGPGARLRMGLRRRQSAAAAPGRRSASPPTSGRPPAGVDRTFLRSVFDHGLLYFTWWVNRKDAAGNNLFQGGFLGLDNIAVFDRSAGYLPGGGRIYQSDGTTWVGFFALQMMKLALMLADEEPEKVEFAAKFFQHFVYIADAHGPCLARDRRLGHAVGRGGRAVLSTCSRSHGAFRPLKARSLVSLIPMIAAAKLDIEAIGSAENGHFPRPPGLVPRRERAAARPGHGRKRRSARSADAVVHVRRGSGEDVAADAGRRRVPVALRHPLDVEAA